MTVTGRIVELWRWPVKSLGGEALRAARLDERGLAGDRTHALWDEHRGAPRRLTARQAPEMLRWSAVYPGAPDDALDPARPPLPELVDPGGARWAWEDTGLVPALEVDLGRRLRAHRDPAGQQDLERSVLVTTEATRSAIEAELGRPLDLRRFRTNLHLELDAPAFAEEAWEGGTVRCADGTVLRLLHPCERCVIPTRDPETGERWAELLRWLFRARTGTFGINARAEGPGRVARGEAVTIEPPSS